MSFPNKYKFSDFVKGIETTQSWVGIRVSFRVVEILRDDRKWPVSRH